MAEKSVMKTSGRGALVSVRGHLRWLKDVTKMLDSENMGRLKKSCFGYIFYIEEMQFQGQLYHILIKNYLNKESESKERMSFTINGKYLEFGPVEYTLMTGLKFSGSYEPPTSSDVHRLVFNNKPSLKFSDISAAFRLECTKTSGQSPMSLKLAFLYVLYGVVLLRDKNNKNIQMKYLHIVDNLKMFNDYAWGRVSYEYLVRATRSRRNVVDGLLAQKKKMAYDAYGFVLALQCWAYEVMPDLAKYCAEEVEGNEGRFPKILKWNANEYFHYDDLIMRFFSDEHIDRVVPLNPTEEEWKHLQILGLERRLHASLLRKIDETEVNSGKQKLAGDEDHCGGPSAKKRRHAANLVGDIRRSSRIHRNHLPENSAESKSPYSGSPVEELNPVEDIGSNVTLHDIDAQLKELFAKISYIESCMQEWKSWKSFVADYMSMKLPERPLEEAHHENQEHVNVNDASKAGDKHETDDSLKAFDHEKPCRTPTAEPIICTPRNTVPMSTKTSNVERPSRSTPRCLVDEYEEVPTVVHGLTSPYTGSKSALPVSAKSCARKKLFTTAPSMYDPCEGSYHKSDTKCFIDWYDQSSKTKPPLETVLPIQNKTTANGRWFQPILSRRGWLSDDHGDALVNLLIFKYNREMDRFLGGWTAMEMLATGILQQPNFDELHEPVMGYVRGTYPRQGGLSWERASRVIGIANVNRNHWVCYEISFEDQCITVYDSLSETSNWNVMHEAFRNMSSALPWLCRHADLWKKKKMHTELRDVWDVVSFDKAPQQTNNSDCGIMAMKYMECLVSGNEVRIIDPERCGIFRRTFCAQLYDFGLKYPAVGN